MSSIFYVEIVGRYDSKALDLGNHRFPRVAEDNWAKIAYRFPLKICSSLVQGASSRALTTLWM
jgi:hypothetical protein